MSITNRLKKMIPVSYRNLLTKLIQTPLRRWIFNKFGVDIVTRKELLNDGAKYHTLKFGSEETIIVSEPDYAVDIRPKFIAWLGKFTLNKPFVTEVINADLIGSTAIGFDEDGKLVSETVTPSPIALKASLPLQTLILERLPDFGTTQLDTACSLVNWWQKNYYHWIVDCLLRLQGLEYYQEQTGRNPILIIAPNPKKWQIESLELLGYKPNSYTQWNNLKIKVKRLVVPSFCRQQHDLISPKACRWLRQRILDNLQELKSKEVYFSPRIYIARPKKVGRHVINESEVIAALAPLGFVAYTLENLSFSDQVRLFSQAEIVVASHGAGLTNIIFAQNLSVIEIFGSAGSQCYFAIAKALDFRYSYLNSSSGGKKLSFFKKYSGIIVDILKLQTLVEEMLSVKSPSLKY